MYTVCILNYEFLLIYSNGYIHWVRYLCNSDINHLLWQDNSDICQQNWRKNYKSLSFTLRGSSCNSPIILKGTNSTNWLLIHSFIFPIFSDFVCVSVKDRRNLSPNTRVFHVLGKRLPRPLPSLHWLHAWWNGWNGPIIKHSIDDFTLQTNILICSTEPTRPPTISQKCLF